LPDHQSCKDLVLHNEFSYAHFLAITAYIDDHLSYLSLLILAMYSARLKAALSKITQDSDQWTKPNTVSYSPSSPLSKNSTFGQMDVMPTAPPSSMFTSYGLKVTAGFMWACLHNPM
jgi:hypothetical protein